MKLRQSKKIMRNVRTRKSYLWIYGTGRVSKANDRMCKYYLRSNEGFGKLLLFVRENPLSFLRFMKYIKKTTNHGNKNIQTKKTKHFVCI